MICPICLACRRNKESGSATESAETCRLTGGKNANETGLTGYVEGWHAAMHELTPPAAEPSDQGGSP